MNSVLNSIKKLLGIADDCTNFDPDIIMHINTVLGTLTQLGVGPSSGFMIEDDTDNWQDYIPEDVKLLEPVKSYIYLRVKLLFDPPLSSTVIESMNRQISELEWRINVIAESVQFEEE